MAVENINIDPSDLTLGELEEVEKITGVAAGSIMTKSGITAAVVVALVYIVQRRTEPSFTLEDARAVKISALSSGDEPDPTEAAG